MKQGDSLGDVFDKRRLSTPSVGKTMGEMRESAKFPELGKRFYELGPMRGEEWLAAYLTKQVDKGRLSNDETHQMAQHFLSLITGGPIRWFVLAFDPSSLSKSALQKHLNSAIPVFMRAHGRIPAKQDGAVDSAHLAFVFLLRPLLPVSRRYNHWSRSYEFTWPKVIYLDVYGTLASLALLQKNIHHRESVMREAIS